MADSTLPCTRDHVRKVVTAFIATGDGDHAAPFYRQGTGTLNMLVLAMLTQIAALYLHRDLYPGDYRNDRHWRHQLVIRLLRMVRAPRTEMWGGGKPIYQFDAVTVGVRELLGPTIQDQAGNLCLRIARLLTEQFKPRPLDYFQGSRGTASGLNET